jgi:hypothetical protein
MPLTPAGTAWTSALDRADSKCDSSFASLGSSFDLFNNCQNLIVAFGAKFEIPLTVPSPSHPFQARRSAISPSSSKNGDDRDSSRDWSSKSVDFKRISLPTLPGHLYAISDLVHTLSGCDVRQLYAAEIRCALHDSFDHVRRHVLACRVGREVVKQNRDLPSFVS